VALKIGLTLPNRGVLFNATTPSELVSLAEIADQSGGFDSVWVGDSLLAKPRLEAITLLAAIASRTKNVKLGPACLASFPLRDPIQLAYQWASLDLLAEGRTILVACNGNVEQSGAQVESETYHVSTRDRVERVTEGLQILRKLWTEDNVSFSGKHVSFSGVTIEPKPFSPAGPPLWLAVHPPASNLTAVENAHRRIIKYTDGWQTSKWNPDDLGWRIKDLREKAAEAGRDPASIATHLYHNVNLVDDVSAATAESKKFLDLYYSTDYSDEHVRGWVAQGTAAAVVDRLKMYEELGFDGVTLRITSWNQRTQLARLIDEVLPHFPCVENRSPASEAQAFR
jgi:alkanesulfonate monooxygenase SsuD/methylene tetrahydromethanopterin reductase-like flavin-dependent oxidoreductase (luciferase family)